MNKKINIRLFIFFIVSLLITLTALSIITLFHQNTTKAIFALSDDIVKLITTQVITNTSHYLNVPSATIRSLSRELSGQDLLGEQKRLLRSMWERLRELPQVMSVYVGDTEGNFLQARRKPKLATRVVDNRSSIARETWFYYDQAYQLLSIQQKEQIYDPRTRPWYIDTRNDPRTTAHTINIEQQKIVYFNAPYLSYTTQSPVITSSYPVLNPNGTLHAVFATDIDLQQLSSFLQQQPVSKNGLLFILDSQQQIVAYPDRKKLLTALARSGNTTLPKVTDLGIAYIASAVQRHQESGEQHLRYQHADQHYLASFVPFPQSFGQDWQIVVIIPESDLTGELRSLIHMTIILSIAMVLLAIWLINVVSNMITRPILVLSNQMNDVKSLHLEKIQGVHTVFKELTMMSDALLATKQGLQDFAKYVPAGLVQQLISTGETAKVGGKRANLTIWFSDIASFSTISEELEAEQLMLHLSDYMGQLTQHIMAEQGTIDKYIGDGVMAFWGAPTPLANSASHACHAALKCQKELEVQAGIWSKAGLPLMKTRFGIHTGEIILGNMGSDERLNYTIIGDNVNLASRLEELNKQYHTSILISETTYEEVKDDFFCRIIDLVAVKGKRHGIKVYELLEEKHISSIDLEEIINDCQQGFEYYCRREFQLAIASYQRARVKYEDKTLTLLIARAQQLLKQGVDESWTPLRVMETK